MFIDREQPLHRFSAQLSMKWLSWNPLKFAIEFVICIARFGNEGSIRLQSMKWWSIVDACLYLKESNKVHLQGFSLNVLYLHAFGNSAEGMMKMDKCTLCLWLVCKFRICAQLCFFFSPNVRPQHYFPKALIDSVTCHAAYNTFSPVMFCTSPLTLSKHIWWMLDSNYEHRNCITTHQNTEA